MQVSSPQWSSVRSALSSEAGWAGDATVALIQWVPSLTRGRMPAVLRDTLTRMSDDDQEGGHDGGLAPLGPRRSSELRELEPEQLAELAQWSDLVVFDYLTGNYDRVASMQDGADKEGRPSVLRETVHNLAVSEETGSLWLLDNESAFLSAYSLLYAEDPRGNGARFRGFHRRMLRTMCIFR